MKLLKNTLTGCDVLNAGQKMFSAKILPFCFVVTFDITESFISVTIGLVFMLKMIVKIIVPLYKLHLPTQSVEIPDTSIQCLVYPHR